MSNLQWYLDAATDFAPGIPLALLGALLILMPQRGARRVLGAFLMVWGAQIVVINGAYFVNTEAAMRVAFPLNLALICLTWALMAAFVWRLTRTPAARALFWVSLAPLAACLAAILVAPERLSTTFVEDGLADGRYEQLSYWLVFYTTPLIAYAATALLFLQMRRTPRGVHRHRLRGILVALLLYVSYTTGSYFALVPSLRPVYIVGIALLAAMAIRVSWRPPAPAGVDLWLVGALVVPALFGLLEAVLLPWESGWPGTLGLWRLASAVVLAFSLVRYEWFDLEIRLGRLAGPATAVAAVTAGAAGAAILGARGDMVSAAIPLISGLAVGSVALIGRRRLAVLLVPGLGDEREYAMQRKFEVYQASLEEAVRAHRGCNDAYLRRLRRQLGISERDHLLLEFVVRRSLGRSGTGGSGTPSLGAPAATAGTVVADRYTVIRPLGEGAHGRAYLARDEKLARDIVIKAVSTAGMGGRGGHLLMREAQMAGSLAHANVVSVYDVLEGASETMLVMEFADGGNLEALMRRRAPMALEEAVFILDQLLAGLACAHAQGIIHRDIKPENILLTRGGTVKIADFGVARYEEREVTGLEGAALGTLVYMSPEQVRGDAIDQRTDLYAAGIVFHQMLTGRHYLPIAGKSDFQVRQLILEEPPHLHVRPDPAWVDGFLRQALAKDPADRFASASDMADALLQKRNGRSVHLGIASTAPTSAIT